MSHSFYPVIGQSTEPPSLGAQPPSRAQSAGGSATGSGTNGGVPTAWPSQQQYMFLRVHIANQFQIQPPVPVRLGCDPGVRREQPSINFDLERQLLQEEQSRHENRGGPAESFVVDDPFQLVLQRYMQMGMEREEVATALAAHDGQSEQSQVVEFCKSYRSLVNMGFSPPMAAGALIRHKSDLNSAAEACLKA